MTQYLKKQKSYPVGRVCESPDCTTRLSIYNQDHICAPCEENLTLEDKFPGVLQRRFAEIQRKVVEKEKAAA